MMFFGSNLSSVNSLKCISMNNQESGFDLTFQKSFMNFINENNSKSGLNVAHHVSEKKIFYSRLSKLALSSIFFTFLSF